MRELRRLVEREVRRADHGDRGRARLGRVRRERHGVGRRLGAAVRGDVEPAGGGLDEEPEAAPPLLDREEHSLAVRAEREDAIEPGGDVAVDERPERVLVERAPSLPERRHATRRSVPAGAEREGRRQTAVDDMTRL